MHMITPAGKIPVRKCKIEEAKNIPKKELFERCDGDFIDPELLTIIREKGLYQEFVNFQDK